MGNLSVSHIHITAQVNACRVTTACVLLYQVTAWVDLTACSHQTEEVWLCSSIGFQKSCCSPCPSFGGRMLPPRGNSPRQFGKRLILKKKRRALCGLSKSNPFMKQPDKHQRNCVAREEGIKKEKAASPRSFSEIVRVHYIDLAACETEALVKPIHPSCCYHDHWPSHRTIALKLCFCPLQNC